MLHCAEYAGGICTYLCEREHVTAPKYGYMKNQPELNEKMRAVLIDWISAVCDKFTLLPETMHLAVNLVDRFLDHEKVTKQKFQLLGATALVIASKYEEIYPPDIKDFIHVTEKAVSKDEILRTESQILSKLRYELSGPSVLRFAERFGKLVSCTDQAFNLALYFAELQLLDYGMLKHLPSLIASAAVYLSQKMTKGTTVWTEYATSQSGHNEEEVKSCAKELLSSMQTSEKMGLTAMRRKYSTKKHLEVGKMKLDFSLAL